MKIQISQQTKNLLDNQEHYFICEKRGLVDMKGKGKNSKQLVYIYRLNYGIRLKYSICL